MSTTAHRSDGTATPTVVSAATGLRRSAARWQFWLLLPVIGVILLLVSQMLSSSNTERFGLSSTELDGYGALSSVLADSGVDIHRAESEDQVRQLMEQHGQAPVAVMVSSWSPTDSVVEHLQQARPGVDPSTPQVIWMTEEPWLLEDQLREAEPGVDFGGFGSGGTETLNAGRYCPVPAAQQAETLEAPGTGITALEGCFLVPGSQGDSSPEGAESADGEPADVPEGASYALVPTATGVIFGAPEAFTNRRIPDAGHAALALNLFGNSSELIWYTPSGADLSGPNEWGSPTQLIPNWLIPLVAWLASVAVVAMVVFGRRHGPVVEEPLPVEVPASEATEGRARLYAQANALGPAAATLRSAHLLRIARMLRLGRAASAATVAEAAARQSGQAPDVVMSLLSPQTITTHTRLVRYAQELADLEDAVKVSTRTRRRNTP